MKRIIRGVPADPVPALVYEKGWDYWMRRAHKLRYPTSTVRPGKAVYRPRQIENRPLPR